MWRSTGLEVNLEDLEVLVVEEVVRTHGEHGGSDDVTGS